MSDRTQREDHSWGPVRRKFWQLSPRHFSEICTHRRAKKMHDTSQKQLNRNLSHANQNRHWLNEIKSQPTTLKNGIFVRREDL